MGYSWQLALMAVFVEGIIFIVLSLTNVREGIFNAIPMTLKSAVSVGIGLFVAFVGLQNAKLIVNSDSTLVTYQHFKGETFSSVGMGAILALLGIVITAILLVKKVKGGILYGILITWVLASSARSPVSMFPTPMQACTPLSPPLLSASTSPRWARPSVRYSRPISPALAS